MDPLISVLIRSKNEERFIGRTLGAVFEQDCDLPFEVILIDSGSTDGTLEVFVRGNLRAPARGTSPNCSVYRKPHELVKKLNLSSWNFGLQTCRNK